VGAVTANSIAGWTHGAGTVFSRTAFGLTTKYYRANQQTTVDMKSKAVSRDQEVTLWSVNAPLYLRLTEDNKALMFQAQTDGAWSVRFVIVGTTGYASDIVIQEVASGSAPSGFNGSDTDGDEWVVGCSGVEVYVKWNGVEQYRGPQIFHHVPGRIGVRYSTDTGSDGVRHLSATFKQSASIYSSPEFGILDVRDFGLKQLTATGSMTAASTTLTLTSNPGFAIGDDIIVEIGGESGAGALGTIGVGGQWPTLTYADATARAADTSQAASKQAGQIDTGNVYSWNGSAWTQNTGNAAGYSSKIIPKALLATITNVSGTTLTLDTAASVSTTGATVYYNCAFKYQEVINAAYNVITSGYNPLDYVTGKTIYFAEGTWWWAGDNAAVNLSFSRPSWTIAGAGRDLTTLNNPKGATCIRWLLEGSPNLIVRDISTRSNRRWDGWLPQYNTPNDDQIQDWPPAFRISLCDNAAVLRTKHSNLAPNFAFCTNAYFDDTVVIEEEGQRSYIGWMMNLANCVDSYALNSTFTSPTLAACMELFQSSGCYYDGLTVTNGLISTNSSVNWRLSNVTMTLEEDCAADSRLDWQLTGNPWINFNTNIDNQQGEDTTNVGGIFEDFTLIQEGAVRTATSRYYETINISGTNSDITIRGQYPAKPNSKGLIQLPEAHDRYAINDTEGKPRTKVQGVRVIGGANSPVAPVRVLATDSEITDCVMDDYQAGGTVTNVITNAAYEAL
jgi:hypothetical protein